MLAAAIVFVLVAAIVLGANTAAMRIPATMARRRLERRLQDLSDQGTPGESIIVRQAEGPLPVIDRLIGQTGAGSWLARLIEQAGATMAPSAVIFLSVLLAMVAAAATQVFLRMPVALVLTVPLAAAIPTLWLIQRRSTRLAAFEEQFPEALELVSRAIRAGHAFQSALGMVAEEISAPVGPEFKKTFDQQNYGLPIRDALNALTDRVPLLDVKFFVTAVAIQRDTGGNLAEILDNLAHVVRERFKIQRQVRVHTAHGRITGYALLALPAFLAMALSFLNPGHMAPLFEARTGQTMIVGTIVMMIVGYVWIRQVIKIEV
jgi:tight adherence protein B